MDQALLRKVQTPLLVDIGGRRIPTNIFLAPMAGCTDLAFRLIAREHGASFCFFEMIDSNCVVRRDISKHPIIRTCEEDSPIAAQLLGSDPSMMRDAAQKLLQHVQASFLDLNFACPMKKVLRKKAGAYLMRDSGRLCEILRSVCGAVKIPVTAKIRSGFDSYEPGSLRELAIRMADSGAKAIFVHGRTARQLYSGAASSDPVMAVKRSVEVPVFGSGDVFSPEQALGMLKSTGCDGVMIARGSLGNPWIFGRINDSLRGIREDAAVGIEERKRTLKKHLSYIRRFAPPRGHSPAGPMRKTALWYLRGFPDAAKIRSRITAAKSYEELAGIVDSIPCP